MTKQIDRNFTASLGMDFERPKSILNSLVKSIFNVFRRKPVIGCS